MGDKKEVIVIIDSSMTATYSFDNKMVVFFESGLSEEEKERVLQEMI